MMAALLGLYVFAGLLSRTVTWREATRIGLTGLVTVFLILVSMREALLDPRAGSFEFRALAGLGSLAQTLYSYQSPIVIFMDAPFGLSPSPYRMLTLLLSAALSWVCVRKGVEAAVGRTALIYLGAIGISLLFGFGIVPTGIDMDYIRWYLWALQAALMTAALVGAILYVKVAKGLGKQVALLSLAIVGGYGILVTWSDGRAELGQNKADAISRGELIQIKDIVGSLGNQRCALIGESDVLTSLTIFQRARAWNYAETMGCNFLNGSWVQPGIPNGRDFQGFPSADVLRKETTNRALFFVGSADAFGRYQAYLEAANIKWRWVSLGNVAGTSVWRRSDEVSEMGGGLIRGHKTGKQSAILR